MGVVEKIKEIEEEMARTQKNKATEYHLGLLKAKLARYRAQLLEPTSKSGPAGVGFDVQKAGDARVALIGWAVFYRVCFLFLQLLRFPSVGKSTLLSKTTHTASETAAYEFTTLTAIPGVIEHQGARIQLLDLPGIVEGASQGRGRGRQVVSTAKTADLIVIMLDATKSEEQKRLLEIELDAVGIRLNKHKPDIVFKKRTTGGISFTSTVKLTQTDEKTIRTILAGYKLHNCDVMIREDITTDDFIDVLIGTRKYIPCLYVYNKIDAISLEQIDKLAHTPNTVVISCEMVETLYLLSGRLLKALAGSQVRARTTAFLGAEPPSLDYLIERMWAELNLVKVYTKKRGAHPDLNDPICLRKGATIEDVCNGVHRSLATNFRYGLVWYALNDFSRRNLIFLRGKSSKFNPHAQKVGLAHQVQDEDVVSIFTK
ncbi:P-loop containing nucleoside triphosphate hydrolase protein [Mycena amicta]|nr:P-loop containing nucleoside triphosphate hydrolase protein [Mycena amicta]